MLPTPHAQPPEFHSLLKHYRLDAGLSQETLAGESGLSVDAVSMLERGVRRMPHKTTIDLLATALQLSTQEHAAFTAAARQPRRPRAGAATSDVADTPSVPLADLFPPARALPVPLTAPVGQERDLATVTALLRGDARLLVLTGPGGAGKTLLALAAACAVQDTFPDGAAYVPLAALPDPSALVATHARMLDLRERDEQALPEDTLARLHGKRQLLLLDNYERVAAAAPLLADLCAACPDLTVLATSRARLRVRGAREIPVQPLALPDSARLPAVAELAHYPAVQLFVQRIQDVEPAFALTPANAAIVAALCQRLDGLPLTIELAAAHAGLLPLPDLLARLERRPLNVLADGTCDLPPRQRSLRASLAWSCDALAPATRAVLRRLATRADGCTLEQAASACTDIAIFEGAGVGDVFGRVATLVDSHLLAINYSGDEPRLTIPALVRAYALQQYVRDSAEGEGIKKGDCARAAAARI